MTEPPRRLRPRAAQRNKTITTQTKGAPSAKGSTAAARPVTTTRHTSIYVPPASPVAGANVITGSQADVDDVSISATVAGAGSSSASGGSAIAIGAGATASAVDALALGDNSSATGIAAVGIINNTSTGRRSFAFGPSSDATADDAIAFGSTSQATATGAWAQTGAEASGVYSTAIGYSPDAASHRGARATKKVAIALGGNTYANGVGSVAIGCDSSGAGAATSTDNEIALGTANHATIVAGKLVIADGSGGLHQIVVSTGGALSTVAYP